MCDVGLLVVIAFEQQKFPAVGHLLIDLESLASRFRA